MRAHAVNAFVVEAIKDEQLPTEIPGFTPGAAFISRLLEQCPSVITPPGNSQDTLPFSVADPYANAHTDDIDLVQLTSRHQRSFELRHPELGHPWHDEFGHTYSSISLKGNNFSAPSILETATATDRLIAYGLQESSVIRRVLRVSRLLRSKGIGTEYLLGLAEPKEYPWPVIDDMGYVEPLPLPEYKRRLVEQYWKQLPKAERTAEAWVELSSKFESMTFYVSARAMDTSYRLDDVVKSRSVQKSVFAYADGHLLADNDEKIGDGFESLAKYLKLVFIPRASANLARLHSLSLAHRYPNGMNVTALGSIVDLDSVHGEPLDLGDEPITASDLARDLLTLLADLNKAKRQTVLFDEAGDDFVKLFTERYFKELSIYNSSDVDSFVVFGEIVRAATELVYSDDEDSNDFGDSPLHLLSKIRDVYSGFFTGDPETGKLYALWKETLLPDFLPDIAKSIEDEVPLYSRILLIERINEMANPSFDVVENFIDKPMRCEEVYRGMIDDAIIYAQGLVDKYYRAKFSQDKTTSEEPLQITEAETLVVATYFALQPEWLNFLEGWAVDFINEQLPKLKVAFYEGCRLEPTETLFPDHASHPITFTGPHRFLMETTDVPVEEVVELIKTTDAEVCVELVEQHNRSYRCRYDVSDEDSMLTEVISDGALDEVTTDWATYVDPESTVASIDYRALDGEYILFVEQKADGTKRLCLQLKDKDSVESIQNSQDIALALKAKFIDPQTLFDADQYKKNSNVIESLEFFTRES